MGICKYCSSNNVVKNGRQDGVQYYLCKDCGHAFAYNNHFVKMRIESRIIAHALDLYYEGLSVRKVRRQIDYIFGFKVSQVTVWKWLMKYSKLVSEYVSTLQPQLSGKYHHDETQLKVGGAERFFWQTIDKDTRYLVAHLLSGARSSSEAKEVFSQALKKQRPIALFTDGSFAYNDAFNKVFYSRYKANRVEWIRKVGIRTRETNNIIERKHGTLKDRLKPMRGLKHDNTAKTLLDGYVVNYNYVRNHSSIGKTPAQKAGIQIEGDWHELITKATRHKVEQETRQIIPRITVEVRS